MITKTFCLTVDCTDPYENLAAEKHLIDTLPPRTAVLYLWQNRHTIVIGRNQDPFSECRVEAFLASGGRIARRYSGGGAVYHDLGNLNYTLIVPPEDFDITRQMAVARRALELCGLSGAEWNGRNDLLLDGRKCSGSAFQMTKTAGCQHGTLLLHTDAEQITRYLTPDQSKLQKHGISSVSSRVINLCERRPDLRTEEVCAAMTAAFSEAYGVPSPLSLNGEDREAIHKTAAFLQSDSWLFPQTNAPVIAKARYPWGGLTVCVSEENGCIGELALYTDALETALFPCLSECLKGVPFSESQLFTAAQNALPGLSAEKAEIVNDICRLLDGVNQNIAKKEIP